MELKLTDLILRRREAPSRRMAAGSVSRVAVLRDARKSALLRTRLIDYLHVIRTIETLYWIARSSQVKPGNDTGKVSPIEKWPKVELRP